MIKTINTRVAGVNSEPGRQAILARLQGDEPFRLAPEPTNPYDPNAVKVMVATASGVEHVGYVPAGIAGVVSKALDGEQAMCTLLEVTGDFEGSAALGLRIRIEIQLPDPVETPADDMALLNKLRRFDPFAFDDDDGSDAYYYGGKW